MKLGRDVPWVKFSLSCLKNQCAILIPVAMATKRGKIAKYVKIISSETRRCIGSIFGMNPLLVDLYQFCLYNARKVKLAHLRCSKSREWEKRSKPWKMFFSETGGLTALTSVFYHLPVEFKKALFK